MNLVFKIEKTKQKEKAPIQVILKTKDKIYKEKAESADKILEKLDKILKKSKIKVTAVKNVKVIDKSHKIGFTSYRIIRSIEKALKFDLIFK